MSRVSYNLTCSGCQAGERLSLGLDTSEEHIAVVAENYSVVVPAWDPGEDVWWGEAAVRGVRLGQTSLRFTPVEIYHAIINIQSDDTTEGEFDQPPFFHNNKDNSDTNSTEFRVIVLRPRGAVDLAYRYGIIGFSVIIYLGFGAQLDFQVITEILKRPIAPAIGAGCQFIIMPLLGLGIGKALQLENNYGFGLLALASSPGGGGSNVFANLLGGDVDLSITMTAFSTVLSLGFMPLWMFALGRFFPSERVSVPYSNIALSIVVIVVPLIIGAIVNRFAPKGGRVLVKIVKPISVIFVLFMLSFGIYANLYAYRIMVTIPRIVPAALLLPWLGFGLGYLVAFAFRQPKPRCVAVCVETGYQNPSVAILTLTASFPQPEGDLGAVVPLSAGLFTPIPLVFAYVGILIRNCVRRRAGGRNEGPVEGDQDFSRITFGMQKNSRPNYKRREPVIDGQVIGYGKGVSNGSFKQLPEDTIIANEKKCP